MSTLRDFVALTFEAVLIGLATIAASIMLIAITAFGVWALQTFVELVLEVLR